MQMPQQRQHVERRCAVQVACRLVRQHDSRIVHECSRDRDALTLAPGQHRGKVPGAIGEVNPFEERGGAGAGLVRRMTREERGQLDVLLRRELVHQLERLEDKSDLVAAEVREGAFGELVDALPRDRQLTGARAVEPADQVQQRRFAAAARTHDRHGLAATDVEVDHVERAHQAFAAAVVLPQPLGVHERGGQVVHFAVPRLVQAISQACNQRRSACRRSTMPSRSSAASESFSSSITASPTSRRRRSRSRRCVSIRLIGSASPPCAAAMSFMWNSARSGRGQLTSDIHSVTRSWPAGVRPYTLRSDRWSGASSRATKPPFSSRASVTYIWASLIPSATGPRAWARRVRSSYPWDGSFASIASTTSCCIFPPPLTVRYTKPLRVMSQAGCRPPREVGALDSSRA